MTQTPAPIQKTKLELIAIERKISAHELAINILTEAGYQVERKNNQRLGSNFRGYGVEFPCEINDKPFVKRMKRSWLCQLANLVIEGVPAIDIALANREPHFWTNKI